MSGINTNGINTNYPIPGVANNSNGFRNNFTSISNNLNVAAAEITDLQNKAIVTSALNGIRLNNDMANTLISNAAIQSFRSTTFNMGADLPSSFTVQANYGDVQYGTITKNTTINFGGWAPAGTQSNVQLHLTIANANAIITFPASTYDSQGNLMSGMTASARLLENYGSNGAPAPSTTISNQVTVPGDFVSELNYLISTTNCGSTLDIAPTNRNRIATRIELRQPTSAGVPGDSAGAICTNGTDLYVCVGEYDGSSIIWGQVQLFAIGTSIPSYASVPVSAGAPGNPGQISYDNDYLYICINANTWKRISLAAGGW